MKKQNKKHQKSTDEKLSLMFFASVFSCDSLQENSTLINYLPILCSMLICVDFPCKLSGKSKSVCTYKKYVDFLKNFNLYISKSTFTYKFSNGQCELL